MELQSSKDTYFVRSLRAFLSRLHWHSHFIQKLESDPRFEYQNAIKIYDSVRQSYDEHIMTAIEHARTGIPFIDGIIRQLQATGWVNFRSRATLVSFVCNTCMQPWQGRFAHWLARLFADYEPGIHYPQIQMQAGTTGINTIRIYNPVKQFHDKASESNFIESWVPELMPLPKHLRAEPWLISPMESIEYDFILWRDYPAPIVDIATANRAASNILYALRSQILPAEKHAFIERHASRKGKKRSPSRRSSSSKKSLQTPPNAPTLFSLD